jgi:Fe-S cluster assembly ATPase SufC
MIKIKNLKVWVWEKVILNWVNIEFEIWKNYCLLWKNGSGKSTLSSFLMWHPWYNYIEWSVEIDWKDLFSLWVEERSAAWLFLSFQNVPEITGINLWEYLRIKYKQGSKRYFTIYF